MKKLREYQKQEFTPLLYEWNIIKHLMTRTETGDSSKHFCSEFFMKTIQEYKRRSRKDTEKKNISVALNNKSESECVLILWTTQTLSVKSKNWN